MAAMNKHDDRDSQANLVRRLCEAERGSAELSAEVWAALTGAPWRVSTMAPHAMRPIVHGPWVDSEGRHWSGNTAFCLTTDLSAAWEEAERRGLHDINVMRAGRSRYVAEVGDYDIARGADARTPALALCAAILAACSED